MSFLSVDTNTMRKTCITLFILMVISWILIQFLPGPFDDSLGLSTPQFIILLVVLFVIFGAAYVLPFVTALYSWFLVFSEKTNKIRIYSLLSALISTGLCVLVILWAIR